MICTTCSQPHGSEITCHEYFETFKDTGACPFGHKVYKTLEEAEQFKAIRRLNADSYKCNYCDNWHLELN